MKQCKTIETGIIAAVVEALNGKKMEPVKQPGNKIRQKYRKFGLKKMEKNMKEGNYTGKIQNLMEPGNENENEMTKTKVEYDGEKDGKTGEQKRQKCKNP